jgi:hypothetical protein
MGGEEQGSGQEQEKQRSLTSRSSSFRT